MITTWGKVGIIWVCRLLQYKFNLTAEPARSKFVCYTQILSANAYKPLRPKFVTLDSKPLSNKLFLFLSRYLIDTATPIWHIVPIKKRC